MNQADVSVVIVCGGGAEGTAARVDLAKKELTRPDYTGTVLVLMTGKPRVPGVGLSEARYGLRLFGSQAYEVIIEEQAVCTWSNMYYCHKLLMQRGTKVKDITIITANWSLERAQMLAGKRFGIECRGIGSDEDVDPRYERHKPVLDILTRLKLDWLVYLWAQLTRR